MRASTCGSPVHFSSGCARLHCARVRSGMCWGDPAIVVAKLRDNVACLLLVRFLCLFGASLSALRERGSVAEKFKPRLECFVSKCVSKIRFVKLCKHWTLLVQPHLTWRSKSTVLFFFVNFDENWHSVWKFFCDTTIKIQSNFENFFKYSRLSLNVLS